MTTPTNHVQTAKVNIPTALRSFTDNARKVELRGNTVGQILTQLTERYPALKDHLYNADGNLRSFISIYLGDEDIRHLDREATTLSHDDEISIVPSIAGGLLR